MQSPRLQLGGAARLQKTIIDYRDLNMSCTKVFLAFAETMKNWDTLRDTLRDLQDACPTGMADLSHLREACGGDRYFGRRGTRSFTLKTS